MAKSIYSVASMKWGATGADGAMGATLTDFTQIADGTVNVNFPEAIQTPITPENADSPAVILSESQPKTIEFESIDLDVAVLPDYFGGSTTTGTFTPGVSFNLPEKSYQYTTRPLNSVAQTWKFPRVQPVVSISGVLGKKDVLRVKIKMTVLTPYDASNVALPEFSVVQA